MTKLQNENVLNRFLFLLFAYFSFGENKTKFHFLTHLFIIQSSKGNWVTQYPQLLMGSQMLLNSLASWLDNFR